MNKTILLVASLLLTLTFSACASENSSQKQTAHKSEIKTTQNSSHPLVVLQTTEGDIEIELYDDIAPLAVENFMTHIKNGYYNGVAFHRIIKDFMIQGGDPTESGRGGESIWKKDFKDEYKDKVFDKAGILAMANRGPFTNGSQFFITTAPTPWLNGRHTIFGQITSDSYTTLGKLNNTQVYQSKPLSRVEIVKAYVKEEGK
ncbi:MAG: peptidylprolyl isomerase [Campylobacterota bacterium]|nr:peptidylprolyl isomerase [Campylobacterota bacterium]